jgi:hypothetical protein
VRILEKQKNERVKGRLSIYEVNKRTGDRRHAWIDHIQRKESEINAK